MAYSVNGKIYTDHPLMDEIVDCCKTIFSGIVVKNDVLAISYETDESLEKSEEYINIIENRIGFSSFPFTDDMLKSYTKNGVRVFDDNTVDSILANRNIVPDNLREDLLSYCKNYYIDNYVEINNYYRSLAGLPPYPSTVYNIRRERSDEAYNIFVYKSDFPDDYNTDNIEFKDKDNDNNDCIFIHKIPRDTIVVLEQNGFINSIINEYKGFNYSYLKYLGYKSINIYKARKAVKWEILYIPTVEQLVEQRFIELYNINRVIYLKKTYQDAMALGSNHYDESIILLLLCQTFNDLIVDVPEWYIRRDIFDIRSVQYFLESFGVEFFEVIPLKYQIAIVKNLNKLIKYKSSTRNINDIIDLFNLDGTYAYKYYLYKKKLNDSGSSDSDNYDLEFIKVKQGEAFDKYIDNNIYRFDYDNLTLTDKFWDGVYKEWTPEDKSFKEQLHETIKESHIENVDFSVEGTKYMSIDYEVDSSDYQYQVQYFFSYLLDSEIEDDDLKIIVPTISTSVEFKISDLFVLMYLLSFSYDSNKYIPEGAPDTITRPEDNLNHRETIETPIVEWYEPLYRDDGDFDDYLKWNRDFEYCGKHWEEKTYIENQDPVATAEGYNSFPIWADKRDWIYRYLPEALKTSYNRINGFNSALNASDLENLIRFINHRNKKYNFDKGYTGYSYRAVKDIYDNLLYYEITYNNPTIEEPRGPLGIAGYRVVKKLDSIQAIMDNFDINTICYNDLVSRIVNSQDRDENVILRYVFNILFTREFDYKFYQVNDTNVDKLSLVLKDRNYLLYNYYISLINEPNMNTRQGNIRSVMNDIVTTLEYYLRGENLEFIYSSFSIFSFNSLLYYIYLMICFFKSWKVYFLDPSVTINSNNILENGNNYGNGIDNIAEIKTNYWTEDKEFKRDIVDFSTEFDFEDRDIAEKQKEVLDIYGYYDPDPTSDQDYDGYTPVESITREKDVNGGVVDGALNKPYYMINGGKSYGKLIDIWDLDGSTPEERITVADADGGYPYHKEDYYNNANDNMYVINAGNPGTNQFFTKSLHTRVINRQIENEVLRSDLDANIIVSDENGLYIKQAWASWKDFDYYKIISDTAYSYINYVMDVLYDDLITITDDEALTEEINSIINQDLSNMRKVVNYAKNINSQEIKYKNYIDNSVNNLNDEFSEFNPYSWENFVD